MIEFNGLTEEQISPVISSVLGADMFSAISAYRKLTKKNGEETMLDMISLCDSISTWISEDEDFATRNMPRKCCANCVGRCGQYCAKMENGAWDRSENVFVGNDCISFEHVDDFLVDGGYVTLRHGVLGENDTMFNIEVTFQLEDGIFSILREKKNARNKSVKYSSKKAFIAPMSLGKNKLIKHIRRGLFTVYRRGKVNKTLFVFGQEPIEGETYSQYFSRAQAEYRRLYREATEQSLSMSYDEACRFIRENMVGTEADMWDYATSPEQFLCDFYGGISVWERAEEIKREQLTER